MTANSRPHQDVSASRLARQLLDAIDDHLVPARRLADEGTWIGAVARTVYEDLHSLQRRLHVLAEEWLTSDRRIDEP